MAAGLSKDDALQDASNKSQEDLRHPESIDKSVSFVGIKELEGQVHDGTDEIRTLNIGPEDDLDLVNALMRQTLYPKPRAKSQTPNHTLQLTLSPRERSSFTVFHGEAEDVNNSHSLDLSSEDEFTLQPELHVETGVDVQPERARGRPKWVTSPEDVHSQPHLPRSRRRRSWLWNQFFVIEEYRGPEPVLIGRVSF